MGMVYQVSFDTTQIELDLLPSFDGAGGAAVDTNPETKERRRNARFIPVPDVIEGNADSDWALWADAVVAAQ